MSQAEAEGETGRASSRSTETEIKLELGGAVDHRRLVEGLGVPERREAQENSYLDTPDLRLAGQLTMLRLRVREGRPAVLTLKSGTEVEAGNFRSIEIEAELGGEAVAAILERPASVYELDLPPVRELRKRFGELPLGVIGTLFTERLRFPVGRFTVEVDRMLFPDGTEEHEVEIETLDTAGARAWLEEELRRLGVEARPGRETKFERLLRVMGRRPEA